jgi:hypothetical protein
MTGDPPNPASQTGLDPIAGALGGAVAAVIYRRKTLRESVPKENVL